MRKRLIGCLWFLLGLCIGFVWVLADIVTKNPINKLNPFNIAVQPAPSLDTFLYMYSIYNFKISSKISLDMNIIENEKLTLNKLDIFIYYSVYK